MPRKATKTTRTATAKKTATTKKTAATPVSELKKVKLGKLDKAFTKAQIFAYLSETTELSKKDISKVFESLQDLMQHHLKKRSLGEFTLPGLAKFATKRKPATKARKGINPFTGEEIMFKAKPASTAVKIRPLQKVKDMVE